ncbi:MAG: hypothetical protein A3A33_02320 [Candidatus Yanofskybacteria bacterium RIFCSPLOWO2_01_FULL_49_25]|uniref:Nudix hydrolase domain-containing protein n=1 Tax=Candidatus Yanofskybacteria bacterium RIFCSPLOWO2_01_FULL_49_25 TaxID=1802701 RepID=A0A1F8GRW9_9BACT|nr:MAG: hypothetical protein A3A33_02320 [Candidatus Yanofskybacteria bacterium RIFCSPLOWO2_01_FULL_49_25]
MSDPKDLYYVAVKVFLGKDGPPAGEAGKLFIFKDKFGDWDLPGGRIRKDEFATPLEQVIKRKMREELGDAIEYSIGEPIVFFRHERNEVGLGGQTVRIFGVGYKGKLISGDITMSEIHTQMEWVDINTFKPEEYFTGGWLKGVRGYLEMKRE